MSETLDLGGIYRGLKDFQLATVEHAAERLYGPDSTRRFLIADEVGLGKTLVARGLIAKSIEHHLERDTPRIDIVYICSNVDIARQNVARLNVLGRHDDFNLTNRITLLPRDLRNLQRNRINFVSFTPGTSLDLRSSEGIIQERILIYRMLRDLWGSDVIEDRLRDTKVFAGYAGFERFHERARADMPFDAELAKNFGARLADIDARIAAREPTLQQRFERLREQMDRFADVSAVSTDVRAERSAFVSTLRAALARACIHALEPDLVILDEFQRFKHIFDEDNPAGFLARQLFDDNSVRVVLLSATPYKMYTLSDEQTDDHYEDFLATMRFLMGEREAAELAEHLRTYRTSLFDADRDGAVAAARAKGLLELTLRRYMARTERLAVSSSRNGMLAERPCGGVRLDASDVRRYLALAELSRQLDVGGALTFWQATPYPLTFMDDYELDRALERRLDRADGHHDRLKHLDDGSLTLSRDDLQAYRELDPANVRLRWLAADVLDSGAWKLLWMPPSLPYYGLAGAFADERLQGFTKRLIFSAWRVVPKAIGAMLSYEAERRMMLAGGEPVENTQRARERFSGLLRFQRSNERLTGMPVFALLYPSPALAELGDPRTVEHGGGALTLDGEVVRRAVAQSIEKRLERHTAKALEGGNDDERWYWAAPLLLDLDRDRHGTLAWFRRADLAAELIGHEEAESGRSDSGWREHVGEAVRYIETPEGLGPAPADLPHVLAEMALAGPGVAALRALDRINGAGVDDPATRLRAGVIAWGLRSLFNQIEATHLLRAGATHHHDDAYWRLVLRYCVDGCLQAVLDEYAHVLREGLGLIDARGDDLIRPMAEAMHEAVTLRTVNYRVRHIERRDERLEIEPARMRGAFALPFGDDRADGDNVQRTSSVRVAFNSPFRPFVLATTSVGQEGLDFHTYCHAVVHWNLPSNPVDLEQREGRVHRYKGHAIRKNIAAECRAAAFSTEHDPWEAMFAAASERRRDAHTDLVPYWIYAVDGGAQIERYVPAMPLSRDIQRLDDLKRSMAAYRLVFGQPRQEDLVAYLKGRLTAEALQDLVANLSINVTPAPLSSERVAMLRSAVAREIPVVDGVAATVAASVSTAAAYRKERYQRFWELLLDELRHSGQPWRLRAPGPSSWMELSVPGLRSENAGLRSGYVVVFASRQRLRIELYVDDPDPDQQRTAWEHLVTARAAIEERFGGPLTWEELPKRRASRIAVYYPGEASIDIEDQWADYVRWIVPCADRLRAATMAASEARPSDENSRVVPPQHR